MYNGSLLPAQLHDQMSLKNLESNCMQSNGLIPDAATLYLQKHEIYQKTPTEMRTMERLQSQNVCSYSTQWIGKLSFNSNKFLTNIIMNTSG